MAHAHVLSRQKTGLVVIDLQEKFRPAIAGFDPAAHNAVKLILAFQMYKMPVLVTEQYPKGLGKTVEPVARQFRPFDPIEKTEFDCAGCAEFLERLKKLNLATVVLCGVETHVCVNQTAFGLLEQGLRVQVVVDAAASRKALDHETALRRMEQGGVILTTTETALFELCGKAGSVQFKNIQQMVKAKFTGWKTPVKTAPKVVPSKPAEAAPTAPTVVAGLVAASGSQAVPVPESKDEGRSTGPEGADTVLMEERLDEEDTSAFLPPPDGKKSDDEELIASVLDERETGATATPGEPPETKILYRARAANDADKTQPLLEELRDTQAMEDLLKEADALAGDDEKGLPVV